MAVVILLVTVVVYVALRAANTRKVEQASDNGADNGQKAPKLVHEAIIGDVKFELESSTNMGSVLEADTARAGYQEDITTTDRFVKVVVTAQNKGKVNTEQGMWSVGNVVDSEGRNFLNINNKAFYFLPQPDLCGAVLKPEFEPTACVMFYEVSKKSKGLKVQVAAPNEKGRKQEAFLDLKGQ